MRSTWEKTGAGFWLATCRVAIIGLISATATAGEVSVEYLSSTLWSGINDIEVQESLAYLTMPYGLVICDMSDPADPVEIGRLHLEGEARGLGVSGNLVCVASTMDLHVVDVTDPSAPVLAGSWRGMAYGGRDVVIIGDFAYLTGWTLSDGLFVIDISSPAIPTLAWSDSEMRTAMDIAVAGDYAFLSYSLGDLLVLDVSVPSSPSVLAFEGGERIVYHSIEVELHGNQAYIIGGWAGINVFDITDPAAPTFLTRFTSPDWARDIAFQDDYAYVADSSNGIAIYDVSDPATPALVDSYLPDPEYRPTDIEVFGDHLVTNMPYSRLAVLDVSSPAAPSESGHVDYPGRIYTLALVGDKLWVGDDWGEVHSVDVTDPSNPTLIPSENVTSFGGHNDIVVQGDYLYAATEYEGVAAHSLTNPSATPWRGLEGHYVHSIAVQGELMVAYTGDFNSSDGRLHFYDISDPLEPDSIAHSGMMTGYGGVTISGDYLYAGGYFHGFAGDDGDVDIFDISDPSSPSLLVEYEVPSAARDVAVVGDLAYVPDNQYGLVVLDVSDRTSPVTIGQGGCWYSRSVTVAGSIAYLSREYGTVCLIDISVPETPTTAFTYVTSGYPSEVNVNGDLIYIADTYGVQIARVTTTPGACCLSDGSCAVVEQTVCETILGGTYLGLTGECLNDLNGNGVDDACEPVGACCLPSGGCTVVNQTDCEEFANGTYQGDGTECLGDLNGNGDDDGCEPTGACCLADGSCVVANQTDCETTLEGFYWGDESPCLGDADENGFDDACVLLTCCVDRVGDANGLGGDEPTIGDASVMIDAKFITGTCAGILDCLDEADINQSGGVGAICDDITIGDISTLIDYLFITGPSLGLAECL